jgi:hypothetical protein
MENLNLNIEKARLICSGKLILDKEHKIDSFVPINNSDYFKYLDLNNHRLLTVGTSSDEVFNGSFYNSKDITLM